jgi:hypothetical protein
MKKKKMSQSLQKRKKPCKSCPFRRDNNLEGAEPGGSHPFVYVGQSLGPFWLPCHMDKEYKDKNSDPEKVDQCAGAAIYRANTGTAELMPDGIMTLPEDKELVFASHEEFLSHYMNIPIEDAKLSESDLRLLLNFELNKASEIKIIEKTK